MASFVTLELEDYNDLIRDAVRVGEMMTTLDLILDALKEHTIVDDGKVYLRTFVNLDEIQSIIEYRHPVEWHELERQVKEAAEHGEH